MNKCKDCIYYNDSDTYPGTGYCYMAGDYVKESDICEDFEED